MDLKTRNWCGEAYCALRKGTKVTEPLHSLARAGLSYTKPANEQPTFFVIVCIVIFSLATRFHSGRAADVDCQLANGHRTSRTPLARAHRDPLVHYMSKHTHQIQSMRIRAPQRWRSAVVSECRRTAVHSAHQQQRWKVVHTWELTDTPTRCQTFA